MRLGSRDDLNDYLYLVFICLNTVLVSTLCNKVTMDTYQQNYTSVFEYALPVAA